jgi:hypothetical protein
MDHSIVIRADPSPLAALFLGHIRKGCTLFAPCHRGGSSPILDRVIHLRTLLVWARSSGSFSKTTLPLAMESDDWENDLAGIPGFLGLPADVSIWIFAWLDLRRLEFIPAVLLCFVEIGTASTQTSDVDPAPLVNHVS